MFVLPPPPRYPNGNLYGVPGGGGLLETNNTLDHPSGPEYQLVAGEGTYVLHDSLHLATPPPHPSDAPQPNNNPLATTIGPPQAGVKLSICILAPKKPPTHGLTRVTTAQSSKSAAGYIPSIQEETKSDAGSTVNGSESTAHAPTFGDGNPALQGLPTKGKKDQKLKPKNNIVKSNSSYVSRVIPHETLSKRLTERSPEGMFAFANVNRAFMWLDLSSDIKTENMTKVLFTKAHPLCHDVNPYTKSSNHLDIIIGFNTGDSIWYEPMSQKYARLNKNGQINDSAIQSILWIPHKENLFLAAHHDGTLIAYDKDKEDAPFTPEEDPPAEDGQANGEPQPVFKIEKSVQSRDQKTNPVAAWKISNMKINSMAFSPDGRMLALACEDGTLTIMDPLQERVLDVFRSYYGAMLCVAWSPDSRYVLTGGQDDMVSVWSLAEQALVARCVGHESWVTAVTFDPWRCDERNYRFGSVGEDCRLLLWDFSVGMLGRPKAGPARNRGPSVSSHRPQGHGRVGSQTTLARLRSNSTRGVEGASLAGTVTGTTDEEAEAPSEVVHAVDGMAGTAMLPPVMSKSVDAHPLCWLGFEAHCIITSCKDGHIREWDRPKESTDEGRGI